MVLLSGGGVLRDSAGAWISGCLANLGAGDVIEAEFWGVFYGLQLAWSHSIRTLDVECDSKCVVDLIMHPLLIVSLCSAW